MQESGLSPAVADAPGQAFTLFAGDEGGYVPDTSRQNLAHTVPPVQSPFSIFAVQQPLTVQYGRQLVFRPAPGPSQQTGNWSSTPREKDDLTAGKDGRAPRVVEGGEGGEGGEGCRWVGELGEALVWEQSTEGVEHDRIVNFGGRRAVYGRERGKLSLRHAVELVEEVGRMLERADVDRREHERLGRKFGEMERCGEVLAVRKCECCGEVREASGSYGGSHRTCKVRICPACSWVRARQGQEYFERLYSEVDGSGGEGYEWQFLTVTTVYRYWDDEDLRRPVLRKRIFLLKKFIKKLWDGVLKVEGAGLFRVIELSARGHVHAHLLYYGPMVDKEGMDALAQKVGHGAIGHTRATLIFKECNQFHSIDQLPNGEGGEDGEGDRAAAIGRVAKYMMKGTSTYGGIVDEGLEAGDQAGWTMSPILAARWESAAVGVKLSDKYGSFRGVKVERAYKYEPPDDKEVACKKCGVVGEWETTYVNAGRYLRDCHKKGKQGLMNNNWLPWWRRAKLGGSWRPPPAEKGG